MCLGCTGREQSHDGRERGAVETPQNGESTVERRSFLQATALAGAGTVLGVEMERASADHTECVAADRFVPSPNYGTRQEAVDWIVMHVTTGTYTGAINWFQNPDSKVSAHYVVSNYDDTAYEPGHVTQMVHHEDNAWHARTIANHRSIGIELEWIDGHNPDEPITAACYEAASQLVRCIADQYDVPLEFYDEETCIQNESGGIIGHTHVPDGDCSTFDHDGRTCPYPDFDPETFMDYLDEADNGDDSFEYGDEVVTTANLNGREQPGLDSDVIAVLDEGTTAEVVNGPERADDIIWWGLHEPVENHWVWCSENYLELYDGEDSDDVSVELGTDPITDVGETNATLNGELLDFEGTDEVDIWFEYGSVGSGFPESTGSTTFDSPGAFSSDVSGLSDGTDYEVRAVGEAIGTRETGGVQTFTTDEDGSDGGSWCFITTATARDEATLDSLRRFRDDSMGATPLGRALVGLYYRISPPVARTLERHPESWAFRATRRIIETCASLSDRQTETDSRVKSASIGTAVTGLYIAGTMVGASGHVAIRARELLSR